MGTAGVTLPKGLAGQWGSLPGLGPAQGRSTPGASLPQFPREQLRDGCPGRDPPTRGQRAETAPPETPVLPGSCHWWQEAGTGCITSLNPGIREDTGTGLPWKGPQSKRRPRLPHTLQLVGLADITHGRIQTL